MRLRRFSPVVARKKVMASPEVVQAAVDAAMSKPTPRLNAIEAKQAEADALIASLSDRLAAVESVPAVANVLKKK